MQMMTAAGRRYQRRLFAAMGSYVVALVFANWAIRHWQPDVAALIALSILPALPIICTIVVMGLYVVEETDEYLRTRVVTAMLGGLGFMLAVSSAWGFLEESDLVPHAPAYWAFVLWCMGWGLSNAVQSWRDRTADRRADA